MWSMKETKVSNEIRTRNFQVASGTRVLSPLRNAWWGGKYEFSICQDTLYFAYVCIRFMFDSSLYTFNGNCQIGW